MGKKLGERFGERWRRRARLLKKETVALYLAYRDPRVSWYARLVAAAVVAYALSPIDLIPDPIPVLGYLDDLVLVPLGVWVALRLIPDHVMTEARLEAATMLERGERPVSRRAAFVVILLWFSFAAFVIWRLIQTPFFRSLYE